MAVVELQPASNSIPRVRELRKQNGWSRKELAERAGVDAATIGGWERGETPIPDKDASVLAEIFRVYAEYLLNLEFPRMDAMDRGVESAVLRELSHVLGEAALRLPAGSEWRWALIGIRRHMRESSGRAA